MRTIITIIALFTFSCDNSVTSNVIKANPLPKEIDYKRNVYHLFLGQSKDSVKSIVQLNRDFEADRDSTFNGSIMHYYNIYEDGMKVLANQDPVEREVTPTLYFTFSSNKLTAFECAIMFTPVKMNETEYYNFLGAVEPYFSKLHSELNKKQLSKKLSVQFNDSTVEESFIIDTTKGQEDLIFKYSIKIK